jgi:hypothetical protein
VHVADYPVKILGRDIPVITMNIEGHRERMMVDSGSPGSLLTDQTYAALHRFFLDTNFVDLEAFGIGGEVVIRKEDLLDVQMGPLILKRQPFLISGKMISAKYGDTGIDGVIGNDILLQLDEAYDMPHHVIGFYGTLNCHSVQTPWLGDYAVVPVRYAPNGSAGIPYLIDDHEFTGIIDTGSTRSFVTQRALEQSGIKPETQKTLAAGIRGYGGFTIHADIERFGSVTIGAEEFSDPWLMVGNTQISGLFDVIIGSDFLASHRVFVDNFNHQAFVGLSIPASSVKN